MQSGLVVKFPHFQCALLLSFASGVATNNARMRAPRKNNSFVNLLAVDHCHRALFRLFTGGEAGQFRGSTRFLAVTLAGERHATSAGDRSLRPTRFGRLTVQTNHFLFRIVSTVSGTRNGRTEREEAPFEGVRMYGRRVCDSRFSFL